MQAAPAPAPPVATPVPAPVDKIWAPSGPVLAPPFPVVEPTPPAVTPATETPPPTTGRSIGSYFGLGLDVGLPDGANLAFVVRPASFARLHVAGGSNTAGAGFRGGLTLIPYWFWFVAPSFNFEVGFCRVGEVNSVVTTFFQVPSWMKEYAQQAGYTYYNGQLGLEFGKSVVTGFLHAGVSYVSGVVRMPNPVPLTGVSGEKTATTPDVVLGRDATIQVVTISAKVGIVVHFGGL